MLDVSPHDVITSSAAIKHDHDTTIIVTIRNQSGQEVQVSVPPNTTVMWEPPAGWTEATFRHAGCPEVVREIESSAAASG